MEAALLTAILAAVAGFFCYFYRPYWGVRRIPGPPVVPILGHIPLLATGGPDVFSALAKQYGPLYRFHLGRQPLVMVADAELCREVGIKKFKSFTNRSMPSPLAASSLHAKGLFMTRDSRWSTMRNAVLSFYQPSYIASLIPTMHAFIETATRDLDAKQSFTLSDITLKIATDVVGKTAFGVDFGLTRPKLGHDSIGEVDDEVQQFINQHIYSTTQLKLDLSGSISNMLGMVVPFLQKPVRQILNKIPGTMDWKTDRTLEDMSRRLDKIVEDRRKDAARGTRDLMSLMLSANEARTAGAEKVYTHDYISGVSYEQLLAGSTTTSFTLSSIVYLVSCHPEVEEKLYAEIDGYGRGDELPTAHDLQTKFPYIDLVIKEAMRFYTASPLVAREASEDVTVGGYLIPKGTWVWLAIGVLAKDPKNFPEPDKFKPERFDPNGEEEKNRHPYANIPFGLGPRVCVGQKFTWQEMKLAIIHLYRNYTFRHSPEMENPLQFQFGIILNFRYGVKVQAFKRERKK